MVVAGSKSPPGLQFHRGQKLGPEQVGAAAVMGQCRQRIGRVEIALHRAIVGFKGPEGQQHLAGQSEFGLDPVKDRAMPARHRAAPVDAVLRNQPARKLDERHLEHALRPVGAQHLGILPQAGREPVERGAVDAPGPGFGFQPLQERVEVAATGRGRAHGGGKPGQRPGAGQG